MNEILTSLKKERMNLYLPVTLKKELEEVNKFLKKVQKGRQGNKIVWCTNLPHPYSAGNEIEARFFGYEQMLTLINELLQFVPARDQQKYKNRIPLTPLLQAIQQMPLHVSDKNKDKDLDASFEVFNEALAKLFPNL